MCVLFLFSMADDGIKSPPIRYTCITCRVAFQDPEKQRSHYKTDWHRYNLKRKVAELSPVTAEAFQEKVLAQREATSASTESNHKMCEVCRKHFTSNNSYNSHLRSRRHREMAAKSKKEKGDCTAIKDSAVPHSSEDKEKQEVVIHSPGSEKETSVVETDSDCEPEPLKVTECLFCPHESADMEQSLNHMTRTHGFFIPELEYLVDINGLISYLCEKVGIGYTCLYCNERGKTFYSVESVQQHMVNKCHCKLFFEDEAALEYAEYYDYSKSYRDHKEFEEGEENALALPEATLEVNDALEMVLPSGARVGHRALRHYYKQRLPTQEQRKSSMITRLMSHYRALGWKSYGKGEGVVLQQRDVMWTRKMQSARSMKLSMKANKMQHHFRPQVVF